MDVMTMTPVTTTYPHCSVAFATESLGSNSPSSRDVRLPLGVLTYRDLRSAAKAPTVSGKQGGECIAGTALRIM